jgi:hypothetical protein
MLEWLSRLPPKEDVDEEEEDEGAWLRGFTGMRTRGPWTGSQKRPLATVNSRGTTIGVGDACGWGSAAVGAGAAALAAAEEASRERREERGDNGKEDGGGGGRSCEEGTVAGAGTGGTGTGGGLAGRGPSTASSAKEFHWNHSCQWVKVVTHKKPWSHPPVEWRTMYPQRGSSMSRRSAT